MPEYSINSKTRSLGWAYNPVVRNGRINQPTKPEYTGSVKSICQQIQADRQFQADKENLRYSVQWFYRGEAITGIDDGVYSSKDETEIDTIIKSLDISGAVVYTENEAVYTAPKRGKGKPRTLPIENCPECGKVMRSNGKTQPDKDGHRKQRYKCTACGHNLTVGGGGHGGPRAESFNPPDKPPLTNAERQANFQKRKREAAAQENNT